MKLRWTIKSLGYIVNYILQCDDWHYNMLQWKNLNQTYEQQLLPSSRLQFWCHIVKSVSSQINESGSQLKLSTILKSVSIHKRQITPTKAQSHIFPCYLVTLTLSIDSNWQIDETPMRRLVRGNYFQEADYWLFALSVFHFAYKGIVIGKSYHTLPAMYHNIWTICVTPNTNNTLQINENLMSVPPNHPSCSLQWVKLCFGWVKFLQLYWKCMCYLSEYSQNGFSNGCHEKSS